MQEWKPSQSDSVGILADHPLAYSTGLRRFSKWSLAVAATALIFFAASSHNRQFSNWSWTWIKFKPFRCDSGPTIYGLGPGGKLLVDGKFYLLGPILITHSTNTPLPSPTSP